MASKSLESDIGLAVCGRGCGGCSCGCLHDMPVARLGMRADANPALNCFA